MIYDIIDFAWIDEVSHPEMFTQLCFLGVEIDPYDASRANHASALNDIQADAAQAKYRDCRAGLYFHGESNGTNASGDTATDVADLIEWGVLAYLGYGYFGKHGEV